MLPAVIAFFQILRSALIVVLRNRDLLLHLRGAVPRDLAPFFPNLLVLC